MTSNMSAADLAAIAPGQMGRADRAARRRNARTALGFMVPALVMVLGFLLMPVVMNVWFSFTKWRRFQGFNEWAGVDNYERLVGSVNFAAAFQNTIIWVVASLILPVVLGLSLALLLRNMRFEETAKTIFFLPRILAPTAVGVIWFYVYAPDGILNNTLGVLGLPDDVGWLYQANTITYAIIVTFVWQMVGLPMVLLLLGLAALPKDPIEAAKMDGATPFQVFTHITLPLLSPTILIVVILSVLAGFTAFDHIWVMGTSFPGKKGLSLTVYMYYEGFSNNAWGFASAIAVVLGLIVLGITWVQAIVQDRVDRMLK